MKKLFSIAFVLILALAMLSGCSESEEPGTLPEEIPEENWDRDAFEHWQNGENGEKLNTAEHEIGEDWVCAVCKSEIIDWSDGSYDVMNYDENHNILRQSTYASDGTVTEFTTEYVYDENGNIISSKGYENGVLYTEDEYMIDPDGNQIQTRSTMYLSDGLKQVTEYNGPEIARIDTYYADGSLYYESVHEYALSDDGMYYLSGITETDHSQEITYEYKYNEQNDCIAFTEYNSDKMVVYTETTEYEYNEEGWTVYKKSTVNGLPSEEIHYGIFDDGEGGRWTYYEKHIVYNADGSYTVFEHDENDEIINETSFDANGNEI